MSYASRLDHLFTHFDIANTYYFDKPATCPCCGFAVMLQKGGETRRQFELRVMVERLKYRNMVLVVEGILVDYPTVILHDTSLPIHVTKRVVVKTTNVELDHDDRW